MAEGRMLKKVISESRRLADLKTDSGRMLYTWIIPHLDIEGRLNASADMIKGKVVPRLNHFDKTLINECLEDMNRVGLVTLYEFDGDRYLQLRKFQEHQTLRPSKEAKSIIPPGQVQDKSGLAPGKEKRRERKRREYSDEFLSFWKVYPKKGCNKVKAWMEWEKVERPALQIILDAIVKQDKWRRTANGDFRPEWKDAERWIKYECWNDEVEEKKAGSW